MTRIVRLVSLVPPLISIFWGVKSKLTASRQPCNHTLTPYATLGAMLTFLHFFKKALRFKRNNLKTKPKIFSPILSRVNRCRALPFARAIRPWKMACLRQVV